MNYFIIFNLFTRPCANMHKYHYLDVTKLVGDLVLHLSKDTYEQLGLEGKPAKKYKNKHGKSVLFVIVF